MSFPAGDWPDPEPGKWRIDRLDALAAALAGGGSTALMVVHGGGLVWQAGDVARKSSIASIRKSLLNLMFGIAVERGQVDIAATLGDLGIDDIGRLTPRERNAAVRDLLMARSGVYHPSVYDTAKDRPERGAHAPGAHWFYNNWDFNALGTVFSVATGETVPQAFGPMLAEPLGMQDYAPGDIRFLHGPESVHPVYKMRFSARDLARIGLLVLNKGRWHDRQIVLNDWLEDSLRPHSQIAPGRFYGLLWAVTDAQAPGDPMAIDVPIIYAAGFGGQYVVVAPDHDLVVVHRAADVDTGIGHARMGEIMRAIVEAMPDRRPFP
jgi:CubicO group peptidase (beta-lactamase class C family)